MPSDRKTGRDKVNEKIRQTENLSKVLQISKAMQTRFQLIPASALNRVTVAGVRDMRLGRIGKDGKPVGANVIRVNNPSPGTKSDFHRICIDPKGVSNKANPHIPVSAGTVQAAESLQKGLQITGKALFVISLVASGVRVGKSIYDEVTIDDEIYALENIISGLEEDLQDKNCTGSTRRETQEALDYSNELLAKAKDYKRKPGKKTFGTICCIGAEYGGAAAAGYGGAQAGALIGAPGGPVGAVAGAVTGGIVGAVVGSEVGRSVVENFECDGEHISTELHGSLIDWGKGKNANGEVLGVDGNMYLGENGVEVGANASLFDFGHQKDNGDKLNISVLKTGANLDINNKGVDVGVEGKLIREEIETENVKVGVGLNVDTGVKVGRDGVKMEVLGFGFSAGNDGFGFKLPFFDIKFKN